jgi:hypothetical protein
MHPFLAEGRFWSKWTKFDQKRAKIISDRGEAFAGKIEALGAKKVLLFFEQALFARSFFSRARPASLL